MFDGVVDDGLEMFWKVGPIAGEAQLKKKDHLPEKP